MNTGSEKELDSVSGVELSLIQTGDRAIAIERVRLAAGEPRRAAISYGGITTHTRDLPIKATGRYADVELCDCGCGEHRIRSTILRVEVIIGAWPDSVERDVDGRPRLRVGVTSTSVEAFDVNDAPLGLTKQLVAAAPVHALAVEALRHHSYNLDGSPVSIGRAREMLRGARTAVTAGGRLMTAQRDREVARLHLEAKRDRRSAIAAVAAAYPRLGLSPQPTASAVSNLVKRVAERGVLAQVADEMGLPQLLTEKQRAGVRRPD